MDTTVETFCLSVLKAVIRLTIPAAANVTKQQ